MSSKPKGKRGLETDLPAPEVKRSKVSFRNLSKNPNLTQIVAKQKDEPKYDPRRPLTLDRERFLHGSRSERLSDAADELTRLTRGGQTFTQSITTEEIEDGEDDGSMPNEEFRRRLLREIVETTERNNAAIEAATPTPAEMEGIDGTPGSTARLKAMINFQEGLKTQSRYGEIITTAPRRTDGVRPIEVALDIDDTDLTLEIEIAAAAHQNAIDQNLWLSLQVAMDTNNIESSQIVASWAMTINSYVTFCFIARSRNFIVGVAVNVAEENTISLTMPGNTRYREVAAALNQRVFEHTFPQLASAR